MTVVEVSGIEPTNQYARLTALRQRCEGIIVDLKAQTAPLVLAVEDAEARYAALKQEQREMPERISSSAIDAMITEDGSALNALRQRQQELEILVGASYLQLLKAKHALAMFRQTALGDGAREARRELSNIFDQRREIDRAQSRAASASEILYQRARDAAEEARNLALKIDTLTAKNKA